MILTWTFLDDTNGQIQVPTEEKGTSGGVVNQSAGDNNHTLVKAKNGLDDEFSDENNKMLFDDPEIGETANQILKEMDSKNRKIRQSVSSSMAERRKVDGSGQKLKVEPKRSKKVKTSEKIDESSDAPDETEDGGARENGKPKYEFEASFTKK